MAYSGPQVAVGAVAVADGALLLIQRATAPGAGLWSLPGGRVEQGEALRDAVVREVAEETGLAVSCHQLVGWVERMSDTHHFIIFDFAVTVHADSPPARAGDDAAAVRWCPLDQVTELALVPGLAEFLGDHNVIAQNR